MTDHIDLGKEGEAIAKNYLVKKGFQVLHTNWTHEDDEVDIIGMDREELVFVEVKTRSTDFYGYPEEDVGRQKERFLIRAAEAYIDEKDLDVASRFDIVAIILNPHQREILHIEDAFYPT
jgi:putative endonuclease